MSESAQSSVGQVLRDAREAQRMTLEDAAARLRLMLRQVEAMETDDFGSLGPLVFARGFVRNYARLLGLAPEALLARMEGAPAEPTAVSPAAAAQPHSWLTSPWLILLLLGLLLLVGLPVALYWWLNSEAGGKPEALVPPQTQSRPPPIAVPAPVAEPTDAIPPVVEGAAAPVPVAPSTPAPESPVTPAQDEAGAPEAPAISGVLHLEFSDEAWVEIKDATDRTLYRQLNRPGSSVDVAGQPPFDVVIGNAAHARVTYNGRPIDLKPFIAVTVARFTLEE